MKPILFILHNIEYYQLIILIAQCLVVAAFLLVFFRLRTIFGLGLFYIAIGLFKFMHYFYTQAFSLEIASGIHILIGPTVITPAILFSLLLIYIREDAGEVRKIIYALIFFNFFFAAMLHISALGINGAGFVNKLNLPEHFFRMDIGPLIAGSLVLFIDGIVLIVFYEFISKKISSMFLRIFITMTLVLFLHAFIFNSVAFIFKPVDASVFKKYAISILISKAISIAIYTVSFWLYITYFERQIDNTMLTGSSFRDVFNLLTYRQKYALAHDKLIESEKKYKKLTENTSFGIGVSKGTKLIFANKKLLELFMVDSIDRFNEKLPLYYLTPESREKTKERMKKVSQGEEIYENFEIDIVRTDGEQRTLELGFTNITIDGKPCRLSTYNDITERKQAEKALRQSEERYRLILNTTLDGFIMADEEGKIMQVNPGYCNMIGYSEQELLSMSISDVEVQQSEQETKEYIQRLIFEGKARFETRHRAKDGRLIDLDVSVSNLKDGEKTLGVTFIRDITERKQAEDKLKAANQQLQASNQQLQATEQQLIASNQELKRAFEELNTQNSKLSFLYNLSLLINKSLSIDDIIKQSLEQINSMLKPDVSFFFIKNNEELNLKQVYPFSMIKAFDGVETHKVGECICGLAVSQNKALYSKNIFEDIGCTWDECKKAGLKSFAALPLSHETKVIGLIGISAKEERDFEKESEFLETISEQISSALIKSQLLQAIKDNEARLKEAERIAKMGNFTWDIKSGDVTWSDGLHELLGYDKAEKIDYNRVNAEIHHPADLERITAWLNECIVSGKTSFSPNEYRLLRKDDKVIHVQTTITVAYKDNVPFKMFGTVQDITERKQAEEELKASENRLKHAEKIALLGHWELNLTNNVLIWSDEVFIIFDLKPQEFEATYEAFLDHIHPDDREKVNEAYTNSLKTKTNYEIEHRLLLKNGEIKYVVEKCITEFDDIGKPIRSIGTVQDITERKHAEKELRKYHEHLEELVEERTKELQFSNKELEAFAYSVSHDLRAPLRAINGFTRILMEDYIEKLDDEGKRLGTVIQNNAQKMGKLIDDLLAFSRLGRASIHFTDIDMKNMANAIYHEVSSSAERKRIKFSVADLPDAYGDTNMLRQVWTNLISNATKFSSKREKAVISISGMQDEEYTTYQISDNGVGFDMQFVNKIFDVFQRLHTETEFPGTGVGLSLVQRIIHRHKGKVWAQSEIDKGSTFYFSLPKKEIKAKNKL